MIDWLLFAGGLAFFMLAEAWKGFRPRSGMPLAIAPLFFAAVLALLIGGTLTVSPFIVHAVEQIMPPSGADSDIVVAVISAVIGLWLVSIIVQLARNLVRRAQGRDAQELRWIDNPFAGDR